MTKKDVSGLLKEAINQYQRKNSDEAKAFFFDILDQDPANPEAHYYLGLIFSKENNHQKAVIHLKSVVDAKNNFLFTQQCRMILGYIYYENQEYQRAKYEYLEVLKTNLQIVQVYAALGAVCYKLGEKSDAFEYARSAYELDSYNLNAKNTYGFLLCDLEIDLEQGLDILKEVTRLKSDNPAYLDSLGWAYYKKGDKKSAAAFIRKSLDIKDDDEVMDHLDIVLNRVRERERVSL